MLMFARSEEDPFQERAKISIVTTLDAKGQIDTVLNC